MNLNEAAETEKSKGIPDGKQEHLQEEQNQTLRSRVNVDQEEEKSQQMASRIREGQMDARRSVARSMKNDRYPIPVISKITGLSEDEVNEIY